MSRRLLAFGIVAVLAACGDTTADTTCAEPDAAADRADFASIVIVGTAADWDGTTVRFEVEQVWRGPTLPAEISITVEEGRAYAAGVRYLAFPTVRDVGTFVDTACSATTRWDESLTQHAPATIRYPVPPPPVDPDLPWEWLLAGLVVAAGARLTRWGRERRHRSEPVWDPDHRLGEE